MRWKFKWIATFFPPFGCSRTIMKISQINIAIVKMSWIMIIEIWLMVLLDGRCRCSGTSLTYELLLESLNVVLYKCYKLLAGNMSDIKSCVLRNVRCSRCRKCLQTTTGKITKTTYYCTKYVVPLQQITNRRSKAVTDETNESEYNKI